MAEIQVVRGTDTGKRWTLHPNAVFIGRDPNCGVMLTDRRVSRRHCRVDYHAGRHHVTNLSQTNGTYVNSVRVEEAMLADGDDIVIGETRMRFYDEMLRPQSLSPDSSQSVIFLEDSDQESPSQVIDLKFDSRASVTEGIATLDQALDRIGAYSQRFEIIRAVGESVVSELDLDKVFDLILDQVFRFVPAERGCILLFDAATGEFAPRAVKDRNRLQALHEMPMSRSILKQVLKERVAILSTDAMQDQRFAKEESIILQGIRSMMSAPMLLQDSTLGIISVDSSSMANAFSRRDIETLSIIANLAALAIRNAEMVRERVQAETTRRTFSRFLPPALMKQITEEGRELCLGGETAEVTILFADIRNFTAMCERKTPDDVVSILNACFHEWTECIFHNGGTLDKYIGDAVLAVFGSPEPYPDHTLRAARAALEIRDSIFKYETLREEIKVGTALHRGFVIHGFVGSESRMQYTVIGDTVNTAARLCKVAAGNQVVVTRSILEAEGPRLITRALPSVVVPGKTESIDIYDLIGVVGEATDANRTPLAQ